MIFYPWFSCLCRFVSIDLLDQVTSRKVYFSLHSRQPKPVRMQTPEARPQLASKVPSLELSGC